MAWVNASTLDDARVMAYVRKFGFHEHDVLKKCRLETIKNRPDATMMTAPEEAAFIAFMVRLSGVSNCLEIGTFTGYSSLSVALALPENGRLTVCELDAELLGIAAGYWQEAGVSHKIQPINQNGIDGLNGLITDGKSGTFDLVYIDADKTNYPNYYELALQLLQPGGMIILDNMLWNGKVANRQETDDISVTLRQLNQKILEDQRVESVLTALGDGVTFATKR